MEPQVTNPPATDAERDETTGVMAAQDELVTDDLLVEDVSIDGMCGVY